MTTFYDNSLLPPDLLILVETNYVYVIFMLKYLSIQKLRILHHFYNANATSCFEFLIQYYYHYHNIISIIIEWTKRVFNQKENYFRVDVRANAPLTLLQRLNGLKKSLQIDTFSFS